MMVKFVEGVGLVVGLVVEAEEEEVAVGAREAAQEARVV